jgi:hypothetical protein
VDYADREAQAPRQQYWSVPNRAHADSQPTTAPAAFTRSTLRQFTGVVQPAATQPFRLTRLAAVPCVTLMNIGRFEPAKMPMLTSTFESSLALIFHRG